MASSDTQINLNVGGEGAKGLDNTTIDVKDRDPNDMNSHLKTTFEEIFAEPHPTIYSFDGVWTTSFKVFRNTKLWCYRLTTLLCAVPASFLWGICFALLSCSTIWCCRPFMRCYDISMDCLRGFLTSYVNTFIRPCYEALGYVFANIHIHMHKGGETGKISV